MKKTFVLLVLLCSPCSAALKNVNRAGQTFDIQQALEPNRPALVFFHLSSSQPSRAFLARLPALAAAHPEMDVLVVDVNQMTSPVAREFKLTSAPYVQEYDKKGNLSSEGAKSYNHLVQLSP
jgi:hypothetical protein